MSTFSPYLNLYLTIIIYLFIYLNSRNDRTTISHLPFEIVSYTLSHWSTLHKDTGSRIFKSIIDIKLKIVYRVKI